MKFKDNIHTALWGHEEWVCSAHPSAPSEIADGPHAGEKLDAVYPGFPLLMKVIDAKSRLSVQVHPNEVTRKVTGGDPKTEMWCMLDDGFIYAGLKPGVGPAEIEAAVGSGRFEELMVRHDAKAGDVFFIPGGLVHAIGDNARIFEVQQSSNTTFRLYDWGRVGADGKPRELHVAKSLQAIDYSLKAPEAAAAVKCQFFDFRPVEVSGSLALAACPGSFTVLTAFRGNASVNGVAFAEGESVLVPEGVAMEIVSTFAKLLVTTL